MIDYEIASLLLSANFETGQLFWKERDVSFFNGSERIRKSWNTKYAGKEALTCVSHSGYKRGAILHECYQAHRVLWLLCHKQWPKQFLDHVNGNTLDNSITNLREVNHAENMKNVKKPITNSSGVMGVSWDDNRKKWVARIKVNRESKHLGRFKTFEEACAARKEAEIKYGFHENHGRNQPSS